MNGQIELYGFTIEWWATKAFDDGFDWRATGGTVEETATLVDDYYADVHRAVSVEFEKAAADQAVEDMIDQAERAAMFGEAL